MIFYYAPGSCSLASHVALLEADADFVAREIDFRAGEQRSAGYLAINPKGKVPALDVGGVVITENVAIQYYIATTYAEARLCPADPLARIYWLSLISWISNTVQPDARHITRPENYCDDPGAFDALRDKGRKTLSRWLGEFDARLSRGEWMMGDQYTTADPYALVFIGVAARMGVETDRFANCRRWQRQMLDRPAVRTVLELERGP